MEFVVGNYPSKNSIHLADIHRLSADAPHFYPLATALPNAPFLKVMWESSFARHNEARCMVHPVPFEHAGRRIAAGEIESDPAARGPVSMFPNVAHPRVRAIAAARPCRTRQFRFGYATGRTLMAP